MNDFKPAEYSIDGLTQALIDYFYSSEQVTLVALKIGSLNNDAVAAACRSFAELIVHDRKCY